ncbi:hypothetical protein MN608_07215 [Microdochium nivale]|nr:hypothetical protein MN608_07215 [Microdochium nivale]
MSDFMSKSTAAEALASALQNVWAWYLYATSFVLALSGDWTAPAMSSNPRSKSLMAILINYQAVIFSSRPRHREIIKSAGRRYSAQFGDAADVSISNESLVAASTEKRKRGTTTKALHDAPSLIYLAFLADLEAIRTRP